MQTHLNNDDFYSVSGEGPASNGRTKLEFPSTTSNDGAGRSLQRIGLSRNFIIKTDEAKEDQRDPCDFMDDIILFINGLW